MGKKSRVRRSPKFATKFSSKFPLLKRKFRTKPEITEKVEPELLEEEVTEESSEEEVPPPPKPKPKTTRKPRKRTTKPRTTRKTKKTS